MQIKTWIIAIPLALSFFFCSKKSGTIPDNHAPLVKLEEELKSLNPFTFQFTAVATDVDADPLSYSWDFGEGTIKEGKAMESFSFPENKNYTVTVTVKDGHTSVKASIQVNTLVSEVSINENVRFQEITGFGGFGAQDVYWSQGPFSSPAFINNMVNDLGISILRDELPTSFELVNDNNDPLVTDLSKYNLTVQPEGHHQPLGARINYFKELKAAGVKTFIASVWSPPIWMKHNNQLGNGTTNQNSAPPYSITPGSNTNQLKTEMYDEFAEMCVAYIRILKKEADIDLYALGIQNEPRFSQFYQSCVYNGEALKNLLKVVGKRFKDENIQTKIFLPEDIGFLQGIEGMIKPTLDDPTARVYADIVAVHGYDLDGVTANSPNAQTWQKMYNWGAAYNKPLWMTETSGYENNYSGALSLAKAMFTALKHGNVSAWVFWTLSTSNLDAYSLISSAGVKSKRYFISKNFYRFIRPGAVRVEAVSPESENIFALAFQHVNENTKTVVLLNDQTSSKVVKLNGANIPPSYMHYITSDKDDCRDAGATDARNGLILPPKSVVTLYYK
jgi:O-glycosyl hydrolase